MLVDLKSLVTVARFPEQSPKVEIGSVVIMVELLKAKYVGLLIAQPSPERVNNSGVLPILIVEHIETENVIIQYAKRVFRLRNHWRNRIVFQKIELYCSWQEGAG